MAEAFKERPTVADFGLPTAGNTSSPVLVGRRMSFSDPVRPKHFPQEPTPDTAAPSVPEVRGRKLNIFGDD